MDDPCKEFVEQKIKVKEIIIDEIKGKYYYSMDKDKGALSISIYEYDDILENYVKVKPNNPLIRQLTEYILDIEKI